MARPADKQTMQKLNYLLIYALFYKIIKMYEKITLKNCINQDFHVYYLNVKHSCKEVIYYIHTYFCIVAPRELCISVTLYNFLVTNQLEKVTSCCCCHAHWIPNLDLNSITSKHTGQMLIKKPVYSNIFLNLLSVIWWVLA